MADNNVYDSSPGGGQGNGTTSGQTGINPLESKSMEDLQFPTNAAQQEEAEERYQPNPPMPERMTDYPSTDGPFQGLVSVPHGNAIEGTPDLKGANLNYNSDLEMSREQQQAVVQAAMDATSDGMDNPSQEV